MFSSPRRRAWLGFISALACAGACAPTAAAYGGAGAFNPVAQPPTYPGSSSPADAYQLVGTGIYPDRIAASQPQVAARWVVASAHAPMQAGLEYRALDGRSVRVAKVYKPVQPAADDKLNSYGVADISVALLESPLAAPAGGFPLLMQDPVGLDLAAALPGYVLWTGVGGPYQAQQVRSGWTKPGGDPVTGTVEAIDGDSGSAGAWYRAAGARPVFSSVTRTATKNPFWSRNVAYSAALTPANGESHPTVAAWMKSVFARHPEAAAPEFTTLTAQGIDFSKLRPGFAGGVEVKSATPTSVTLGWNHSPETRVPRTGYRVTIDGATRTLGAAEQSTTFSGLATGRQYQFAVTAFNANGDAVRRADGEDRLSYVTRLPQAAPTVELSTLREINRPEEGQESASYCLKIRATHDAAMPNLPSDLAIRSSYQVRVGPVLLDPANFQIDVDRRTVTRTLCDDTSPEGADIDSGSPYTVAVRTIDGGVPSPWRFGSTATPDGVASGTLLTRATDLEAQPRRAVTADGKTDYCLDLNWTPAAAVAGFPHGPSTIWIQSTTTGGGGKQIKDLPASTTKTQACGLKPNYTYRAEVWTGYEGFVAPLRSQTEARTPAGAPSGTALLPPANVVNTTRKRGPGDYCIKSTWTAPPVVAGFPVTGYAMVVTTPTFYPYLDTDVASTDTSAEICGLAASTTYIAVVAAAYPIHGSQVFGAPSDIRGATTPA